MDMYIFTLKWNTFVYHFYNSPVQRTFQFISELDQIKGFLYSNYAEWLQVVNMLHIQNLGTHLEKNIL